MYSVSFPKSPPGGTPDRPPEFRVNIAIGAAIIVQTAFVLVWAGAASERLAQLESRAEQNVEIIERTARLEEQARFMSNALRRIETKLDHVVSEGGD